MNHVVGMILAALVFVIVLAVCSPDPAQDELKDRELYCRMVKAQKWPDYRHTYKAECGGNNPPKYVAD